MLGLEVHELLVSVEPTPGSWLDLMRIKKVYSELQDP